MKKRILSLLGVMVILASMLLLGACKPKKPSGDNNGNNNGSNNGIISLENVRNTTFKRYSWGDPTDTTHPDVKKKIDWIYEQTGVKEEHVRIAYGQMDMKYVLDISADNAPDALYLTDERFPRYIVKGLGQPLEKFAEVTNSGREYWQKIMDGNPFKWKGETYGLTEGINPYYVWYNKTMFEENDVKTPVEYYDEGNWTFDTLADCAKKLTADTDGDGTVDRYGFACWKTEGLIYANGGQFFEFTNDGDIRVALKDQATINALQFVQDGGFKDDWFCFNQVDWNSGFMSEKLAMTVEITSYRVTAWKDAKFEIDFVPMPLGPDNTDGSMLGFASSWGVCTGAKNPYGYLLYTEYFWKYSRYEVPFIPIEESEYWTEEQQARLKAGANMNWKAGFMYGIGEMAGKMIDLFNAVLDGTPVATVVDQHFDVFQHEVDVTLSDVGLPEVLPFNAPPKLDFESDDYLNHIVFEDASGELIGIEQPTLTTDPNEAIDGTSLKVTVYPEEVFQVFRFKDTFTFPGYHTYTISFDYKMLEDMDDGGRFLVVIAPKDNTVGGPYKASVGIQDLMAGDSGTFTVDMDVFDYGDLGEYTLALIGINAGSVVIDNFQVKDVAAK